MLSKSASDPLEKKFGFKDPRRSKINNFKELFELVLIGSSSKKVCYAFFFL